MVTNQPDFVIDQLSCYGNFWGSAARILTKTQVDARALPTKLRQAGCSDREGPNGPQILVAFRDAIPSWVDVRTFHEIYESWNPHPQLS